VILYLLVMECSADNEGYDNLHDAREALKEHGPDECIGIVRVHLPDPNNGCRILPPEMCMADDQGVILLELHSEGRKV